MTICIAYKDTENDRVICASDSFVATGQLDHICSSKKIFEKNGIIYLSAGSYKVIQTLQYDFNYCLPDGNTDDVIFNHFKQQFKQFTIDYPEVLDNDGDFKNELLIVVNKQIYFVHSDLTITKSYHNYACIGSGKNIAYGALYALQNIENYSIKDKLIIAVNACNEFIQSCNNIQIIQSDD